MNNLKRKYKEMFNIVRDELNKIDPIGVVADNPNLVDEYDFENQKILTFVQQISDHKELANKICEIFVESTEINLQPEEFYECAKNILDKLQNL